MAVSGWGTVWLCVNTEVRPVVRCSLGIWGTRGFLWEGSCTFTHLRGLPHPGGGAALCLSVTSSGCAAVT